MKRYSLEEFNALSDKDKRIAIAKDVIAQISTEKYIAATGAYFQDFDKRDLFTKEDGKEFQEVLKKENFTCEVCAKGALFCSDVLITDQYKIHSAVRKIDSDIKAKLPYFPSRMLDIMEIAFEGWAVSDLGDISEDEFDGAVGFYARYSDDNDRLIAIMENIIENDGEFIV